MKSGPARRLPCDGSAPPPAPPPPPSRRWCTVIKFGPDGSPTGREVLEGPGSPDIGVVDVVAHRALAAARAGGHVVLEDVEPELRDLLLLAGLVAGEDGGVQVEGQAEGGEQALRVQEVEEEGHLGDLPA